MDSKLRQLLLETQKEIATGVMDLRQYINGIAAGDPQIPTMDATYPPVGTEDEADNQMLLVFPLWEFTGQIIGDFDSVEVRNDMVSVYSVLYRYQLALWETLKHSSNVGDIVHDVNQHVLDLTREIVLTYGRYIEGMINYLGTQMTDDVHRRVSYLYFNSLDWLGFVINESDLPAVGSYGIAKSLNLKPYWLAYSSKRAPISYSRRAPLMASVAIPQINRLARRHTMPNGAIHHGFMNKRVWLRGDAARVWKRFDFRSKL